MPLPVEAPSLRDQILEAAEELIRADGLSAVTTRAIAERAGCAEGSIYRHFTDKHALVVEICHSRFPAFADLMRSLPERAGGATVRANLEEVAGAALSFFRAVLPLVVGPMNDRGLLARQRRHFSDTDTGPMRMFADLGRYLRAEQALGRVAPTASCDHVTRALIGTCFSQAFVEAFVGDDARLGSDRVFVAAIVATLLVGTEPSL